MENLGNAVAVGRILGPVFLVSGLSLLLYKKRMMKAAEDILNTNGLRLMATLLDVAMGTLILNLYSTWLWSWEVLVTVTGWAMVLKGVFHLLLPEQAEKSARAILKSEFLFPFWGVVSVLIGLYLSYSLYLA